MRKTRPPSDRFWIKVDKDGPRPPKRPDLGPCWLWIASTQRGYGQFYDGEKLVRAHRWAYIADGGVIPNGYDLDHLCRVILCVRPAHLEPVTRRENLLRGDTIVAREAQMLACKRGHGFTDSNTYKRNGLRYCRACRREYARAYYQANK